jgi:hypothetical protein
MPGRSGTGHGERGRERQEQTTPTEREARARPRTLERQIGRARHELVVARAHQTDAIEVRANLMSQRKRRIRGHCSFQRKTLGFG